MKKINKIILTTGTIGAVVAPIGIASACGGKASVGSFYNYAEYTSPEIKNGISQSYGWSEFGDLPEFEAAIIAKKAVAGVSSDYYIAKMAKEGLIQKLDFNELLKDETVGNVKFGSLSDAQIESALKNLYSDQVWQLMSQYDSYLTAAGQGKLYQYMFPYFLQNKVVAINPFKVAENATNHDALEVLKGYDQTAINALFDTDGVDGLSYNEIFSKLKSLNFKNFAVNNYMRDNLMIGSEIAGQFTNELTATNEQSQIDGFKKLLTSVWGEGYRFIDSGQQVVRAIHSSNNDKYSADVALMYNGDTLDAYLGDGQTGEADQSSNGEIRVLKPTNSTYLLDGIVIPSYVNSSALLRVQDVIHKNLLANLYIANPTTATESDVANNKAFVNFDFVNYTTPIRSIYDYVKAQYFAGSITYLTDGHGNKQSITENDPKLATASEYGASIFGISGSITGTHVTKIIDSNLQEKIQTAYDTAFSHNA